METLTRTQAINKAKELLKSVNGENWTFSILDPEEAEDIIWGKLYDDGAQYLTPIIYNNGVVLCHQDL